MNNIREILDKVYRHLLGHIISDPSVRPSSPLYFWTCSESQEVRLRLRLDAPCSQVQMVSLAASSHCTEKMHKECLWTVLVCIGSCSTEVHGPSGRVATDVALVRAL